MYEVTGNEKGVSDFTTVNVNPSILSMKGLAKRGDKLYIEEEILVSKKGSDEVEEETRLVDTGRYKGYVYQDNLHFYKIFRGVEDEIGKLNAVSIRVLFYMMQNLGYSKDYVRVDVAEWAKALGYSTNKSIYDGLFGLLKNEFIYKKTGRDGDYFINVNKIFRGNRIKLLAEENK